jgi:hypothetical protein
MLDIYIPEHFHQEKKYTMHVLTEVLLKLPVQYGMSKDADVHISVQGKGDITIKDGFFSAFDNDISYLKASSLPSLPMFLSHKFTSEENLPCFFGNDTIEIKGNQVIIYADIISTVFFLLSRWEEYVRPERDKFNRFPGHLSFLQKHQLHYRPIVNETALFLLNVLKSIGFAFDDSSLPRFEIKPTHDVDHILRFNGLKKTLKTIAGDMVLRKNPCEMMRSVKQAGNVHRNKQADPFDYFDFLMDMAEKNNLRSTFYFIPAIRGEADFHYDIYSDFIKNRINMIAKRKHNIGIHASGNAADNPEQFGEELSRLNDIAGSISEGRHHYLLFKVPETWQMWNDAGLKRDLSMCYENDGGFRCGIASEFPVYDVMNRKQLHLYEQPTIVMEQALKRSSDGLNDFKERFLTLKSTVKKYHGQFVFLWHQDNLKRYEWRDYEHIYPVILKH